MSTINTHLKSIQSEIDSLQLKLESQKSLAGFISAWPQVFHDKASCSFWTTEIQIWNPMDILEDIARAWGKENWLRVAEGKETINWERKIEGFNVVLRGMENCPPTYVPENAWPIMLEEGV